MKQFLIFAQGALRMFVIMAMIITCIYAISNGEAFIKVVSSISLIAVLYEVYKLFRDTRNN